MALSHPGFDISSIEEPHREVWLKAYRASRFLEEQIWTKVNVALGGFYTQNKGISESSEHMIDVYSFLTLKDLIDIRSEVYKEWEEHRRSYFIQAKVDEILSAQLGSVKRELEIQIEQRQRAEVVETYSSRFQEYVKSCSFLNHIFCGSVIALHFKENLFQMGMSKWKYDLFDSFGVVIISFLLDEIRVNPEDDAFGNLARNLMDLDCVNASWRTYMDFEEKYLQNLVELYAQEWGSIWEDTAAAIYTMIKRIQLDKLRCQIHLKESTLVKFLEKCEEFLILNKIEELVNWILFRGEVELFGAIMEFVTILARNGKTIKERIRNLFREQIIKEGRDAICTLDFTQKNKPDVIKGFVEGSLEVYQKFKRLAKEDNDLQDDLMMSLREFINYNLLSQLGESLPATLLAKYMHSCIKDLYHKRGCTHPVGFEFEHLFNRLIPLLSALVTKAESFEKQAERLFACRILWSSRFCQKCEERLIMLLRGLWKMPRLFNYYEITIFYLQKSKELTLSFAANVNPNLSWLEVKIFTSRWILPQCQASEFKLPPGELADAIETFTFYYNGLYTGRKLLWQFNWSNGELAYATKKNPSKEYKLKVTTQQMAILLVFNEKEKTTEEELMEVTRLSQKEFDQAVEPLTKEKLINAVKINFFMGEDFEVDLRGFELNQEYFCNNKKGRVVLCSRQRTEENFEEERMKDFVSRQIQVAIIRILKRERILRRDAIQQRIGLLEEQPDNKIFGDSLDELVKKGYCIHEGENYAYNPY